jgi:hypothetical protein
MVFMDATHDAKRDRDLDNMNTTKYTEFKDIAIGQIFVDNKFHKYEKISDRQGRHTDPAYILGYLDYDFSSFVSMRIQEKPLKNEILVVDGTNWLVREAVSEETALQAIGMARCMGSTGTKEVDDDNGVRIVRAEVKRLDRVLSEEEIKDQWGRNCRPEFEGDYLDFARSIELKVLARLAA